MRQHVMIDLRLSGVVKGNDQPGKLKEVAGLAAAIADRILERHEAGSPIAPEQFRMLVRAAQMLFDNGVQWPPAVAHVILEVARRVEENDLVRKADVVVQLAKALDAKRRQ
jgi:hypothetical protein